jgi:hypothetical protein
MILVLPVRMFVEYATGLFSVQRHGANGPLNHLVSAGPGHFLTISRRTTARPGVTAPSERA